MEEELAKYKEENKKIKLENDQSMESMQVQSLEKFEDLKQQLFESKINYEKIQEQTEEELVNNQSQNENQA